MKNTALPPLGWLRAFESAARLLSFTAAADELGMTQSAISQQISSLESRFGSALFIRKNRGIALTDDARRLLPGVTDGIAKLREATQVFDPGSDTTLLTVATSISVAQWYLVPRLQKFQNDHPNVRIRIMTAVWPDELATSNADVRIRFCPKEAAGKFATPLGSNRMCLVAATSSIEQFNHNDDHQKTVDEPICSDDFLRTLPILQAVGTTDTWEHYAKLNNLSIDKPISTFVDSHGLAVDFCRTGAGMALTSALICAPLIADGTLSLLHPRFISANDGYYIDQATGSDNPTAVNFIEWLKNEALESEHLAYGEKS